MGLSNGHTSYGRARSSPYPFGWIANLTFKPGLVIFVNRPQIYRSLSSADKMRAIFEMFEFALHQARVGTRRRHPDWDDAWVEYEARRLVTGSKPITERM